MIRYEVTCILFLSVCQHIIVGETQRKSEEEISNVKPFKLILQKSQPYPERRNDSLFTSQLATWLFPTGESSENRIDSATAAGSFSGPQYLPPPSEAKYHGEEDCNPCNQEPWVPMASNIGQETVISFVPPDFSSHISNVDYLNPSFQSRPSYRPLSNQYGPPIQFRPKDNYELPKNFDFQTGPSSDDEQIIIVDYMLPPPRNYQIPSLIYGPPKNLPELSKPLYGPPLQIRGPPKPLYGVPKPNYSLSKPVYGPPKPVYGPPKPNYGPPRPAYGPPPKPAYGPPAETIYGQIPPNPVFNDRIPEQFIPPPPPQSNIHTTYLQQVPISYPPGPSVPNPTNINVNYGPPTSPSNYNPTPRIPGDENSNIPAAVPSDSYGAPVTGDSLNYLAPTEQLSLPSVNNEYLEQPIPLPNLSFTPIAPIHSYADFNQGFSNPQRSFQSPNEEPQKDNDIQIQKSVKVADYLASIEHPINVIQSPIVEVSIKDTTKEEPDENNFNLSSNQQGNAQNVYRQNDDKSFNSINEKLHDDDVHRHGDAPINLRDNPIIVEDIHSAASNINNSFVNIKQNHVKRTNDKQLSTQHFNDDQDVEKNSVNINIIKDILLKQEALEDSQTDNKYVKETEHIYTNNTIFTAPPLDYTNWQPSFTVSSLNRIGTKSPINFSSTTKKPKQIIIPYITNKKSEYYSKNLPHISQPKIDSPQTADYKNDVYTTLLPVYTPPSSTEVSIWSKFVDDFKLAESKRMTATAFTQPTTAVYNIQDLLSQHLPYDILSLQRNIDEWTHQAYSSKSSTSRDIQKSTEKLLTSKKIPDGYFTTQSYIAPSETSTTKNDIFDNYAAGSIKNETFVHKEAGDISTNLIERETATETVTAVVSSTESPFPSPLSSKGQRSLWNVSHTTISPLTKEKVYVVTPQIYNFYTSTPATAWSTAPKIENGKINNASTFDSQKFSIRVEPEYKSRDDKVKKDLKNSIKIVYSEWPHLINNLKTTTLRPTSRHPLFGLMDISAYTPPPNSTVETIAGHSRVASITPPSPLSKKENTNNSERKAIIQTTTESTS